ncbi:hypothetical protein EZI54_23265 [Marinobacter halodurans]|uniref:DUF4760 domain-containing protein n=1 Tax=Marinobacter halodurans TaxID=2528979 RepID=A0ABY1ZF64_9GAMM|nr:hypothetical protein [Marinobacter halodurans]TBW46398.1 hypothetical protein EZI54_23265 [Marinobacter halodurans]
MNKFEVAISTLFVGYFLGQATDFAKFFYSNHRKKNAIKVEVQDLLDEFQYKTTRIEEIAKMLSDDELLNVPAPGKVHNVIYQELFPEVSPYFSKKERELHKSFNGSVEQFNGGVDSLISEGAERFRKNLLSLYYYSLLCEETAKNVIDNHPDYRLIEDEGRLTEINARVHEFGLRYALDDLHEIR